MRHLFRIAIVALLGVALIGVDAGKAKASFIGFGSGGFGGGGYGGGFGGGFSMGGRSGSYCPPGGMMPGGYYPSQPVQYYPQAPQQVTYPYQGGISRAPSPQPGYQSLPPVTVISGSSYPPGTVVSPAPSPPVVVVSNPPPQPKPEPKPEPKPVPSGPQVHALFVFDTGDELIGQAVGRDLKDMKAWFAAGLDKSQIAGGEAKVLSGEKATAEALLGFCKTVNPGPDDAVFVYVGSHGQEYDGEHWIILGDKRVPRRRVVEQLKAHKARLVVVMTDTCFAAEPQRSRGPVTSLARSGGVPAATKYKPLMEDLFLRSQGVVDVNACSPGERSFNDPSGGLMTQSLIHVVRTAADGRKSLTWSEAINKVQDEVDDRFAALKRKVDPAERDAKTLEQQKHQTLYAFSAVPGDELITSHGGPRRVEPAEERASTFLKIEADADVTLMLDGKKLPRAGADEVLVDLDHAAGKIVPHELVAERVVNGRTHRLIKHFDVKGGQSSKVVVSFPTR